MKGEIIFNLDMSIDGYIGDLNGNYYFIDGAENINFINDNI